MTKSKAKQSRFFQKSKNPEAKQSKPPFQNYQKSAKSKAKQTKAKQGGKPGLILVGILGPKPLIYPPRYPLWGLKKPPLGIFLKNDRNFLEEVPESSNSALSSHKKNLF